MFDPMGPFPRDYDSGIRTAIGILYKSEKPGRHGAKQKYSTVRKLRTLYTKMHGASAAGQKEALVLRMERQRWVGTGAPSESEWHSRFMTGFLARVGDQCKRDEAISLSQILAVQTLMEERWTEAEALGDMEEKRRVAEIGFFFVVGYCSSLRGFELPKIVLTELKHQMQLEPVGHIPAHLGLPLHGRFKARGSAKAKILVFIVPKTASGLVPGLWAQRLVQALKDMDIDLGWLFEDNEGSQRPLGFFQEEFYATLFALQDRQPELFEPNTDILGDFQLARSLRRGATTRATDTGVATTDINWMNRWNTGGSEIISGPMHVIYAERKQMLATYLRFSAAL